MNRMSPDSKLNLCLVAGARPNFMKVAPLIHAIQRHNASRGNASPEICYKLVHTGQHYDESMSGVFFRELGIPAPDYSLDVGSGSHAIQTANIMLRFEPVILEQRPHWLVVFGDVNSTVACTLVAAKLGIPVAHVEAGLRSFDRTMPEELNRIVTDALADLLLTPSEDGNENLRREGLPESRIRMVGNIMIDSLLANEAKSRQSTLLDRIGAQKKGFAYVTLHRPANVDQRETLAVIVRELVRLSDSTQIVFPVHPRTRKMLATYDLEKTLNGRFSLLEPLGYHDSLHLTQHARFVLTDSGGLQEEATYFRTPCLTLRPNTERPITISVGSNRLTAPERLANDIEDVLALQGPCGQVPPMWDGKTSERILDALLTRSPHVNGCAS